MDIVKHCPNCGSVISEEDMEFCTECGKPKPASDSWTCECGAENTGKFCTNCGKPRP